MKIKRMGRVIRSDHGTSETPKRWSTQPNAILVASIRRNIHVSRHRMLSVWARNHFETFGCFIGYKEGISSNENKISHR